jgi:hypothetical protein
MFVFHEISTAYGDLQPILINTNNLNKATKLYIEYIISNNKDRYINYLFDLENENLIKIELYETYLKLKFLDTDYGSRLYISIKDYFEPLGLIFNGKIKYDDFINTINGIKACIVALGITEDPFVCYELHFSKLEEYNNELYLTKLNAYDGEKPCYKYILKQTPVNSNVDLLNNEFRIIRSTSDNNALIINFTSTNDPTYNKFIKNILKSDKGEIYSICNYLINELKMI